MKRTELLDILTQFEIRPSKKLGQNFLVDDNLLDFIVRTADIKENDFVIEVGPGLGVLTKKLVSSARKVIAVEFDTRLAEYIRENIKSYNFTLIENDALKVDFNDLCEGESSIRLIANLPYSITTPLLAKFSEMDNPPIDMLFLLQKESADRFEAKSCCKEYGSITVKLQNVYDIKTVRTVSPGVFYPKPEVTSAIVKFTRKNKFPDKSEILKLSQFSHIAFSQRRKKVINNLSNFYKNIDFSELFNRFNLDQNIRAEQISPETFLELSREVNK